MIVKVQISLASSEAQRQVLIYNEDQSVRWQGDATSDVVEHVGDESKSFFNAHMEGTLVVLDDPAPWQDW